MFYIVWCSCVRHIYIHKCYVFWWKILFIIVYCLSLSLTAFFILKSALSDISMATPAFFCLPLAWSIIFHPFTLSWCLSLELRCVSCRQHIVGSLLLIHPATVCHLIGEFTPFTFRVIIDIWRLNTATLSHVSHFFCISFVSHPMYFGLPIWWGSFLCWFSSFSPWLS